jgi:hypothetical protein
MTNDEINRSIATAVGWEFCQRSPTRNGQKMPWEITYCRHPDKSSGRWRKLSRLPSFASDLNAMHEAEKTLSKRQKLEYQEQLYFCAHRNGEYDGSFASWHYIHASAKTRAEAFIATIKADFEHE